MFSQRRTQHHQQPKMLRKVCERRRGGEKMEREREGGREREGEGKREGEREREREQERERERERKILATCRKQSPCLIDGTKGRGGGI